MMFNLLALKMGASVNLRFFILLSFSLKLIWQDLQIREHVLQSMQNFEKLDFYCRKLLLLLTSSIMKFDISCMSMTSLDGCW